MKKLLSLVLALITLLSVATVMAGAADADLAETSATYYVSSKPFENVANANIIGYLGDLDADKEISILDATQVQLSLASLVNLDSTQKLLADTDQDGGTSIMDTTAIQCYIARIATDAKVACTLYTKNATPPVSGDIFDQIVSFVTSHSVYDAKYEWYSYDIDISNGYLSILYFPDDDEIAIASSNLYFTINNDGSPRTFLAYGYDNNYKQTFNAFGYAKQTNKNEKKLSLDCRSFDSDVYSSFSQVESTVNANTNLILGACDKALSGKVSQSVYTLFY